MNASTLRTARIFLAALVLSVAGSFAFAQNAASSSIIGFVGLVAPDLVAQFDDGRSESALAQALLDELLSAGVLDEAVYTDMAGNLMGSSGGISQASLALFVFDLTTGTAPLADELAAAGISGSVTEILAGDAAGLVGATEARTPGIRIPAADASGNVSDDSVRETITAILEDPDVVAGIAESYEEAISPLAPPA